MSILIIVVTELNPHVGYETAAEISLAAGAIAEIARQTLKMGSRSIHPKDTERGGQW